MKLKNWGHTKLQIYFLKLFKDIEIEIIILE